MEKERKKIHHFFEKFSGPPKNFSKFFQPSLSREKDTPFLLA
jgi:hypothetical protein